MLKSLKSNWLIIAFFTCLAIGCSSVRKQQKMLPVELKNVPVNGTDQVTDPEAVRAINGFSTRAANKIVEHGDSISLLKNFSGIETPHTDWAIPYAQGPIKVLYIAAQAHTCRNALELKQRSDFDIDILLIPGVISDGDEKRAPVVQKFFEEKFNKMLKKDYDVIVMPIGRLFWYGGHVKNVTILEKMILQIKAKAEKGCGIVFLHNMSQWFRLEKDKLALANEISPITHGYSRITGQPERTKVISPITDSLTMAFWPETSVNKGGKTDKEAETLVTIQKSPIISSGKCGKGRIATFYYQCQNDSGLIPVLDQEKTPLFGDYYEPIYALYLKAIVWAANKSPQVSLQVPRVTTVKAGESAKISLTLGKQNKAPGSVKLVWQRKDNWGYAVDKGSQNVSLDKQTNTVELELPKCFTNGLYQVNLWLKSGDKIENWGCTAVKVERGIELSVTTDQKTGKPDGEITYQVKTNCPKGKIEIKGIDDQKRIFFNKKIVAENETSVTVDLKRSCTARNRIEFSVYDEKGNLTARKCLYLYIPKIGLDSIGEDFIIASYGTTYTDLHLSPYVGMLYRQAGINTCYRNWHQRHYVRNLAADKNLYSISGASWAFREKGLNKIKKNSPNIPANREKWQKIIDQTADDVKSYGGIGRVLDDETWYAYVQYKDGEMRGAQASQDKYTMELFRNAMKEKYKTIAALNKEWDTDFKSFTEVRAIEEDEVKGKNNPAGWLEFRQYNNWTYANRYYKWVTDQHRKGIGNSTYGAGCGAPHWTTREGGPTYKGGDISFMKSAMSFMMLYGGSSTAYPDAFTGQPGGQKYDPPLNWRQYGSWYHLLTGADALWYYLGHAIIGNELAFRRQAEWLLEGVRDLRNGMGTLIRKAVPINREIRVFYSSENLAMGWLFAKRKDAYSAFRLKHGKSISENTFDSLFRNFLFFQPSYVTADDIVKGDLRDCQILIMPQIFNLSDETAKAIKDYVKNGGCVVADILPGTRSRMGKPRNSSVVSDLFGVDGSKMQLHKEKEVWYSVGVGMYEGKENWKWETTWLPADTTFTGIKPTTAKIGGKMLSKEGKEAPVCLMNDFGKGKTMLLNFVYTDLNNDTAGWHKLFGNALLQWAKLEAPAQIVDPLTKGSLSYRPVYAFKRGQVTLLGSIRGRMVWSGGKPVLIDESRTFDLNDDALFTWKEPKHIYNVREGKYLGHGTSSKVNLPSFHGRLLALLPYKVTGLKVDTSSQVKAGDLLILKVRILTDKDTAKDHVLRMNVYSPTGYHNLLYCKTAIAADGTATLEIPFADNDRIGDWKIVIKDVMSGVEKEKVVEVKGNQ